MSDLINRCISDHMIATRSDDHQHIHEGKMFTSGIKSNIDASSWVDFYFITSTSYEMHLKQIDATNTGGLLEVYICEGMSTGTMGTSTSVTYNRNRNSTFIDQVTMYKNSSWSSTGSISSTQSTLLSNFYIGTTGTVASRVGSDLSNSLEWTLSQTATTYVIRAYNLGSSGKISLRLHYYFES